MSLADWIIMSLVLVSIICYGIYKSRANKSLEGYFLSNRSLAWPVVLLSIMGTQASAVTYLTGPGQAYSDGMRFVQYYFGLPLAMIVISIFFVPIFNKLKVITAYEFLEVRFDGKTRSLTSLLFLVSRGLSTGISIYAPSLVLCALMGWNIYITNLVMGGVLIIYTLSGGARAVAYTQQLQMILVLIVLVVVAWLIIDSIPSNDSFKNILVEAGRNKKLNIITTGFTDKGFDWQDKYNIWSGIIGGFFLALSYFGTDHSQVGRYLTAKNTRESRMGLLMNGLVKVPMQCFILLLGVFVFVFYLHSKAPVFFDESKVQLGLQTAYRGELLIKENEFNLARKNGEFKVADSLRAEYKMLLLKAVPELDTNDNNFIFLRYVKDNLPVGIIGLVFAIIFLSAWGSIAAALNSLAACTMVDFHKRYLQKDISQHKEVSISKWYTFGWGIFSIAVAMFAEGIGNSLIEAVNILGSLFYGVILGIFLVAFWMKQVQANAVFVAACISELLVIVVYKMNLVSFLWLNVIGAVLVMAFAFIIQLFVKRRQL